MATIEKRGKNYRAKIYIGKINGKSKFESISGKTKAEVRAKAVIAENINNGRALPYKTLKEALNKYAADISPKHKGERWETLRLKALCAHSMANKALTKLAPEDIISWRDTRLETVSNGTVLREMNLLGSVLEVCRKEWRWIRENPMKDVSRPRAPPSRKRRVSQSEIDALCNATGYKGGDPKTMEQIAVCAFLFAIETAMRSGEILGLTWAHVHEKYVELPETKNGDKREVPLSPKAREILTTLSNFDKPFMIKTGSRDALFRAIVKRAKLVNLHFHDSRAQAIYQLSKKLPIMDLARVIGHRDLKSLMIYYNESAESLADRL